MGRLTPQQLELINYGVKILKPKPTLTGSQWADEYFFLSPESSAITGKWQTRPWQKEVIDAMTCYEIKIFVKKEPGKETFSSVDELEQVSVIPSIVAIKKPTRVGYSLMLSIVCAYFIHQRPSNQFHYQPNDDEAKGFAEDTVEPMIRDNPDILELVETPNLRGRAKKEKTVKKTYPGGYAEFMGAETERNFNRRTGRVSSIDEYDATKKEVGKAGDVLTQIFRRTSDFFDRKNIVGGKPIGAAYDPEIEEELTEGVSGVDYWAKRGTHGRRYWPCPHCGTFQQLEFEGLIWEKDKDENKKTIRHHPDTAHFKCVECGDKIYDKHKRDMDKMAVWVHENPDAIQERIVSYDFWAILSYSPNVTWPDIVREFLAAKKSKLKLKAFSNEVLARTFEEEYVKVDGSHFLDRLEQYPAQVPEGVLILTFGTDTQDDRIECEVVGWGAFEESWSIEYKVFHGDTSKPEVWRQLDEFLLKTYHHESGGLMRVYCGCVDYGGHRGKEVMQFCRPRFSRRIFASHGSENIKAPIAPHTAGKSKYKGKLYQIGVHQAADVIASHMLTEVPGPGYMHFPDDPAYNDEHFKQLTAEQRDESGRWKSKRSRNEATDCRRYAYASLFIAAADLELLAQRGPMFVQEAKPKPTKPKPRPSPANYLDEF